MDGRNLPRGVKRPYSSISRDSSSPCEISDPSSRRSIFSPLREYPPYWNLPTFHHHSRPSTAITTAILRHTRTTPGPRLPAMPGPSRAESSSTPRNTLPEIIDLTGDESPPVSRSQSIMNIPRTTVPQRPLGAASRAPRFPNNIIETNVSSPDVEFISSRPIPTSSTQDIPAPYLHPEGQRDPDIQITGENRLNPSSSTIASPANLIGANLTNILHRMSVGVGMGFDSIFEVVWPGPGPETSDFTLPDLNYATAAFDLGFASGPDRSNSASPGAYQAPPKAPEGFTRSPEEDDVLVCPKCEGVLCEGETELKRQVWAVKACGHVYCGECTFNRFSLKSKKGKSTTATPFSVFKECVVEGCKAKTNSHKKAMFQIWI